jgi:hypothetical protein
MLNSLLLPVFFVALAGVFAAPASAQTAPKLDFPAASPTGKLDQRVGLTDVAVVYNRPSVKGRKVFGELVPFGQVWRTGANTATSIAFSTDVKFGGADVPAGKYALYTIPEAAEWTVILSKVTGKWGSYEYDAKDDLVRIKVKPVTLAESVETFEIGVGDLRDSSATLNLTWDKTRVPVKLEVDVKKVLMPQIEAAMAAEGKKPYLSAAMFYYEHDIDLKKALGWIEAGIAEQPEAFWMIYRKGLILAKMGDKKAAIAAAEASMALAEKAQGGIKEEYVALNKALIARLR